MKNIIDNLNENGASIEELKFCSNILKNIDKNNTTLFTKEEIDEAIRILVNIEYYEGASEICKKNPFTPKDKKFFPDDWFNPGITKVDWDNAETRKITFEL